MAEIVMTVAGKVLEYLVTPIGRQLGFLFCYRSHADELRNNVQKLGEAWVDVEMSVEQARSRGDEIRPIVEDWLNRVVQITREAEELLMKSDENNNNSNKIISCLNPNLRSRYKLGREAYKRAQQLVVEIQQARNFPDGVSFSYDGPSRSTTFKEYEFMESRASTLNRIMDALRDDKTKVIGVWGMGGVGKTTLLKQVAEQAKQEKLFTTQVYLDLSWTREADKFRDGISVVIQQHIAVKLGLELIPGGSSRVVLTQRPKGEKVLIVLDDIWKEVNLEELEIFPTSCNQDDQSDCKIVLASRDEHLLRKHMGGAQACFRLQHLQEAEAWELFKKTAGGDSIEGDYELRPTAMEVAKECMGLPLAIVAIANALKDETSLAAWKDALDRISSFEQANIIIRGVLNDKVYTCLEMSYNLLKSDEAKSLFLLCGSLSYGDISMYQLLKYAMSLDSFDCIDSLENARNKLVALVRTLKASGLLLDGHEDHGEYFEGGASRLLFIDADAADADADADADYNKFSVRMHDVVRDAARNIINASKNPHRFAVIGEDGGLEDEYRWSETANHEFKFVSFINSNSNAVLELPLSLRLVCPRLQFFLLQNNSSPSLDIPHTFFEGMKGSIKVLDLSEMHFTTLPSMLQSLVNLQTLCLDRCYRLRDMGGIGELKKLQVLSMVGSCIRQLPMEMMQLTDLRLLDLNDCRQLKVIPRNTLSSLSRLECLFMRSSFFQWAAEQVSYRESNASLSELNRLHHLRMIEVEIPDVKLVPAEDNFFQHLTSYAIFIGYSYWWKKTYEKSKTLCVEGGDGSLLTRNGIVKLLKKTEELQLRGLEIAFCSPISVKHFDNLKTLKMEHCHGLKFLFLLSTAGGLFQLEEIDIRKCYAIQEICRWQKGFNSQLFPKLKSLTLSHLPVLSNFGCFNSELKTTSPQGNLNIRLPFFDSQVALPALEYLYLERLNNAKTLWQMSSWQNQLLVPSFFKLERLQIRYCESLEEVFDMEGVSSYGSYDVAVDPVREYRGIFQNLRSMEVMDCHRLKYIFPASVAKDLQLLELLKIVSCGVEEIVANENEDGAESVILFPRLASLTLTSSGKLRCFYRGRHTLGWPLLKELKVENCNNIEILASQVDNNQTSQSLLFVETLDFPKLEVLEITQMESMEKLWHGQLSTMESFNNLKHIAISHCRNLSGVFPTSANLSLQRLETLELDSCEIEEIFVKDDAIETPFAVTFPKLSCLILKNLKELKCLNSRKHISKWPSLKKLEMWNCDKIEILFQEMSLEANLDNQVQRPFFSVEKVAFPRLEELHISNLDNVEKIWHNEFSANSFGKLKRLSVQSCQKLKNIIPTIMLKRLPSLLSLKIVDCDSVEEVFNLKDINNEESHDIPVLQLRELCLVNLKNLEYVWNKAPEGLLTYQNLNCVEVSCCPSLTIPFPGYVVRSLLQVKEVDLKSCGVEEIVAHEDVAKVVSMFLFPEENSLTNSFLHELKCFYLGLHTLEWPNLKTLEVESHESLEKLACKLDKGVKEPIFLCDKVTYPYLEYLNLSLKLQKIHGLEILFGAIPNLKILVVENCPHLPSLFSPNIIRCLNNLKKLTVRNCDQLEEVFDLKGLGDDEMLSNLEEASLISLPKLRHICNNSPPQVLCFQNLKLLLVKQCNRMMHLFPPSMVSALAQLQDLNIEDCQMMEGIFSVEGNDFDNGPLVLCFQNIKFLRVKKCHSWMYLFPCSVVLDQLQELRIEHCSKMEKIMLEAGDVDNRTQQVPSLQNLKFVWVKQCDSLMYLFSASMALNLVQLHDLHIEDCLMMKEIVTAEYIGFDDQSRQVSSFQNLKSVQVKQCSMLTYLFSYSIALALVQLQDLSIENCDAMKEIIREDKDIHYRDPNISCFGNLKFVQVKQCDKLKYLFSSSFAVALMQLQDLQIENCDAMEEMIKEDGDMDYMHPDVSSFQNLKSVQVKWCHSLMYLFSSPIALALVRLQDLWIENCNAMKEIIREDGDIYYMDPKVLSFRNLKSVWVKQCHSLLYLFPSSIALAFEQLKDLHIENCAAMEGIIGEDRDINNRDPKVSSFQDLKSIQVKQCHNLMYLFPSYIALALVQLQDLRIEKCNAMKEIIREEGDIYDMNPKILSFQNLKFVRVEQCHSLTYLFPSPIALALVQLQDLQIEKCDAMKEIIKEDGDIDNMDPEVLSFQNLKFVQVKQCHNLMYLFPFHIALTLVQLQDLQIEKCNAMKEIIREDWDIDNMNPEVLSFQNLKSVRVKHCHSLMYLFPSHVAWTLVQLQDLWIEKCTSMKEIVREDRDIGNMDPEVLSFQNLKFVQVKQCPSLMYLFPSPIAFALVQLQDLQIEECNAMKEIVKKDGSIDNMDPKVLSFQNLKSVQVKQCHSLVYLFPSSIALALVQLQDLWMENCSMMKQIVNVDGVTNNIAFCQIIRLSILDLPGLTSFYLGQNPEEMCTEDSNSAHGMLFNEKVTFPSLEDLHLSNLDNVEKIWHDEFISDSFGSLKRLFVQSCQKLKNIIPSNMLKRLPNLQILKILDCNSVEEVFDLEAIDSKESHDIPDFQLRELCLDNLKNLKYVWNKAPEGLLTYQNLNHVKVSHCSSLKIPFPGYVVRNLLQVKELGRTACGVEEIVGPKDVAEVVAMFLFPEVTSLENSFLDELKCFYLGMDALGWPMLKTLKVESHESLGELAFKLDKDVEQPIFLCDKVAFPCLENLDISNLDTMETIWHNEFIVDSFEKLKRLSVRSCHNMRNIIPFNMLKRLSNLQILEIQDCISVEEVFDLKFLNGKESHGIPVLELRELCLDNLKNLKYIWNEAPQALLIYESLEPIKVSRCPNLEVPFPGYVVRSLLQLKEPNKNCGGGMIVAGVREAKAVTMLLFPEVISLTNSCLKELEYFYLVLHTLEWQALKTIEVVSCESLEMLASKLHKLVDNPIFLCNKVACPSLEELEISNLNTMEKIWHNEFIVDSFGKLKRLSIRSCQKLQGVIPFNMLKSILSLQILEIVDCDSVEEVFNLEAFDGKESHDILDFQLRELCLDNLKNLKYIWNRAPQALLSYQSLEPIKVSHCPNLEVPFPGYVVRSLLQLKEQNKDSHGGGKIVARVCEAKAVTMLLFSEVTSLTNSCLKELECFYLGLHCLEWPVLETLMVESFESLNMLASKADEPFENPIFLCDEVAFPRLENLVISNLDSMETIWHNEFIAKTFGELKGLLVRSCQKMQNIIPTNMLKRLLNLEILEIQDCTLVEEVFDLNAMHREGNHDVLALQLGKLCLDNLKNLKYIWNKAPHGLISYQNLNTVKISHCPSLEIPFPGYVVRSLLQLKDLPMNSPTEWENVEHVCVAKAGTMFFFPEVTSLTDSYQKGLKCFYLGVHTLQWQALETLEVGSCESLEMWASKQVEDPIFLCDKAAFPNLEFLNLSINVKEIQHLDLLFEPLPNLKTLKVEKCPFMLNLFSSDFVKGLTSLQNLTLQKCEQLQVVFDLNGLHHAEGQHVEVLSRLEEVKLIDLPELKSIFQNSPPKGLCFPNLKWLGVKQCGSLPHLFPSSMVSGLAQLQDIRVEHCSMVEQIVMAEEGVIDKISFPLITGVTLLKLPKLESFYQRTWTPGVLFNEEVSFPQLENLNVSGLDNVKGIWHNKLLEDSFGKLKHAEVENCKELQSISSSIVLNWLPSLEFLKVARCDMLTEVFHLEVINVQEDVTCYRLDLVLDDLQKLEHICNKVLGKKLCLQNLKSLKVHNCGCMKRVFSLYMESEDEKEITGQADAAEVVIDKIEFPELASLSLKSLHSLKCFYPGNHDTHIAVLFDEKVAFPSLESLEISDLPNMKRIWYTKLIDNSFGKLEKVAVEKCNKLPNVLSSNVLKELPSLHVLRIASCHQLTEVFDLEGADNILEDETATKLNQLVLHDLPHLEHLWNKDPYGILTFQNLDLVEVYDCQLVSHFPSSSLVRNLSQLEKQLIRSRGTPALGKKDEGESFVFPQVTFGEKADGEGSVFPEVTFGKNNEGEGFVCPKVTSDKLLGLQKIKGKEVVKVDDDVSEFVEDMP